MKKYAYSLKEMTIRLFRMAKPIRGYLIISTLASIIGNLSHMGLMGFGVMWILCAAGYAEGSAAFWMGMTALSGVLIALCRYLEGVFSHLGAYGILAKMRVDLYESIARIAPAFMISRKTGDILNIAVSDIETLEFFFAHMIGPMFTVFILPVTSVIIAAHYSSMFVRILIPVYLMISVIIPLIALNAGRGIGMRYRVSLGELRSLILESVYGMKDIQIYGTAQDRLEKVMKQNQAVSSQAHGLTLHRQTVSALPNFFVYLARILIVAAAGVLAAKGEGNPVGTIVVSYVAAASFSSTFSLTSVVTHLLEAYAAAERLFLIEDTIPETQEAEKTEDCGEIETIAFDSVTFRYPGTENDVLKHASLQIRRGEKIGVIGDSGAGKSTMLRLLLRFYDPDEGEIRFNSTPLRKLSFKTLHERVGLLEQDTYLFDCSIADNIAVSKTDASMEEIVQAAERAGIADFIATLPDGYDTMMGQMGARLSGGERQRIGIARILLKDPDIVIMDEPTSALDVLHEKELLHVLEQEYADRTIIIISHRMSTLSGCSRILHLKDGEITAE